MWDTLYEGVDIILTLKKNFISPGFVGRLRQNLAWSTPSDQTKASWKKRWIAMVLNGKKTGGFTHLPWTSIFFKKSCLWRTKINLLFTEKLTVEWLVISWTYHQDTCGPNWLVWWNGFRDLHVHRLNYANRDKEGTWKTRYFRPFFDAPIDTCDHKSGQVHALDSYQRV